MSDMLANLAIMLFLDFIFAALIKWNNAIVCGSPPVRHLICSKARENSYKPHMRRNYSSLANYCRWELRPMFIQSHSQQSAPKAATYVGLIRQTCRPESALKYELVIYGHSYYWCQPKFRTGKCCRNVQQYSPYLSNLRRYSIVKSANSSTLITLLLFADSSRPRDTFKYLEIIIDIARN